MSDEDHHRIEGWGVLDEYPPDFGQQEMPTTSGTAEALFYASVAFAIVVWIVTTL